MAELSIFTCPTQAFECTLKAAAGDACALSAFLLLILLCDMPDCVPVALVENIVNLKVQKLKAKTF